MIICLICFLLLQTEASARQKEWLALFGRSHGSCWFFAWIALRQTSYLADDKCFCTLSCLRTPAEFKPWQSVNFSPPSSLRPSTSACPPVKQINGSLSSLRPAAASATHARAKSLLSEMGGNAHALWQGRIQCQRGGRGITAEATFVAGCRHLWLRNSNGFWWGRNWDDWDCYLHVDNQTSAHDVISNGVMRPTLYLQPSRFSADQNLLLALIPWIPFLFSAIQAPLLFYLQVFHLYSFTMSCFLLFLSND